MKKRAVSCGVLGAGGSPRPVGYFCQIGRKGGSELQTLSRDRMVEGELRGMQELTRRTPGQMDSPLTGRATHAALPSLPVHTVANHWVTEVS